MTRIFTRVLGAAAIAGITAFTAATPALADGPGNTIGDNLGALLLGNQNNGANTGNTGATYTNGKPLTNNIGDMTGAALVNTAKVVDGLI
jgi:hypothetical protein